MNIITKHSLVFDQEETIISTALSGADQLVMLLSSGIVTTYNLADDSSKALFSVKSDIGYADGGFDLAAKTTIYTLDDICSCG